MYSLPALSSANASAFVKAPGDFSGMVIVVYDRWANYIQRAVYDEHGKVTPMEPFKPF